jgi:hypothetical protein
MHKMSNCKNHQAQVIFVCLSIGRHTIHVIHFFVIHVPISCVRCLIHILNDNNVQDAASELKINLRSS